MKQTFADFELMVERTFEAIGKLTNSKGKEYVGPGDDNRHANMDRLAQRMGLKPEQVLEVYLTKHLESISTWIKGLGDERLQIEASEPIDGRIHDAILYLLLLKGMYERRLNTPKEDTQQDIRMVLKGIGPVDSNFHMPVCGHYTPIDPGNPDSKCTYCGSGRMHHLRVD